MGRGSSPLARGLLGNVVQQCLDVGIIPARAGFTSPHHHHQTSNEDHPRSRGVYGDGPADVGPALGSSPLARGLPGADRVPDRRPVDHPRSRRVYSSGSGTGPRAAGSSPLARGLPVGVVRVDDARRIIPARAGFTSDRPARAGRSRDHPRSRGVYRVSCPARSRSSGSSPLARGLHSHIITGAACAGIIPARAGFTRTTGTNWPRPWDHPRSRGVYWAGRFRGDGGRGSSPLARGLRLALSRMSRRDGSSPLARGLHDEADPLGDRGRIIPARAGVTSSTSRRRTTCTDHPRSRGVYGRGFSAPLERVRIIPARAGFTRPPPCFRRPGWDHPRSRGVYWLAAASPPRSPGSSPLARGLR